MSAPWTRTDLDAAKETSVTDPEDRASLLLLGIVAYSRQEPEASALLVRDGAVAWLGPAECHLGRPRSDRIHPMSDWMET